MKISTQKIPLKFRHLPIMTVMMVEWGDECLGIIAERVSSLEGFPSNSNAPFSRIGFELERLKGESFQFNFYCAKNPFIGHNVISHATNKDTINYNTRFHSVEMYQTIDWFCNFWHEITHLADQRSTFSFNHKNQGDYNAAPMVVARIAREVFNDNYHKWC